MTIIYKFNFLNGISEIKVFYFTVFDDILIIRPAPFILKNWDGMRCWGKRNIDVVLFLFLLRFHPHLSLCYRDHTKPQQRRWQNITVMITLSSFDPFDQTICQSSASRCSAVSNMLLRIIFHYPVLLIKYLREHHIMTISQIWLKLMLTLLFRSWKRFDLGHMEVLS